MFCFRTHILFVIHNVEDILEHVSLVSFTDTSLYFDVTVDYLITEAMSVTCLLAVPCPSFDP